MPLAPAHLPDYRVGLIVPSSNTTMELELPEMFRRRAALGGETFTFHASRSRMSSVTVEDLDRMVSEADRCAVELADANVDVIAYACLVALMAKGAGYHHRAETRLAQAAERDAVSPAVVTSAGALLDGIRALGAQRISVLAPYLSPVTDLVVGYIEDAGVEVIDLISLEIADNAEVGRLDPMSLLTHLDDLHVVNADAVVLSACVQCPSLPAIPAAEARLERPVLTAAGATAFRILDALGLDTTVPGAGALLDGTRSTSA